MHKIQVYIESAFGIFCTLVFNSFRSSFNINISDNTEECIHVYPCANGVFRQIYFKNKFLIINLLSSFILGLLRECYAQST